jgi:hypothetical protein
VSASELLGRLGSAAAGCLLAGVLSLAVWPGVAQAAPAPRCVVHGRSVGGIRTSRVLELTGGLIVYRTRYANEGQEVDDVWACGRRSNRFVLVGREESQPGYPEGRLSAIHAAGDWLIATQETGLVSEVECEKYEYESADNCPLPTESLLVVNAASGLGGSLSGADLPAGSALLSAAGAVAWWSQTQEKEKEAISSLYGCVTLTAKRKLVCKPRLVAQGSIPEASVRLVGTTLSWTAAGERRSSVL